MTIVENIDCMDGMKKYPDKYFDLACCDVNYGIKQGGDKNKSRSKIAISKEYHCFDDSKSPDVKYFNEVIRVSKHQIFWGANHFISKIPYDSQGWIVWDKNNGNTDFADCELAYTSINRSIRIFRFTWSGFRQGDMKNKEVRIHPCQKPKGLYRFCYEYANLKKGDKILDTHLGSGNSRIVAELMGFDFVGFENDKLFYNDHIVYYNSYVNNIVKFGEKEIKQLKFELV